MSLSSSPWHRVSPTAKRRAQAGGSNPGGSGSAWSNPPAAPLSAARRGAHPGKPRGPVARCVVAPARRLAPLTWPAQHCADIAAAEDHGRARSPPAPLRPSRFPVASSVLLRTTSRLHAQKSQLIARHPGLGENNRRQTPPPRAAPPRPGQPRPLAATPRAATPLLPCSPWPFGTGFLRGS